MINTKKLIEDLNATCDNAVLGDAFSFGECQKSKENKDIFLFKDGFCYKNNKKHGKIIYSDDKVIQFECISENKYMNGQIVSVRISQSIS